MNRMRLCGIYIDELSLRSTRRLVLPTTAADGMADKTYIVRFKPPEIGTQVVVAEGAQIYGEHLVFVDSQGALAALFLIEIVENWTELAD
jgi:hypothetical protein